MSGRTVTDRVPIVFVGPHSGYGPGGRIYQELLRHGRTYQEVAVGGWQGPDSRALREQVRAAVERARTEAAGFAVTAEPALVGVGIGTAFAAQYAADRPESISSLTLVAPWQTPTAKMRAAVQLWEQHTTEGSEGGVTGSHSAAVRAARLLLVSSRGWEVSPPPEGIPGSPIAPRALDDLCTLFEGCLHAAPDYERIVTPTLVIACAFDEFAGSEQSTRVFGAVENCRLAEIESGHAAQLERPAELADLTLLFATEPEAYPAGARLPRLQP